VQGDLADLDRLFAAVEQQQGHLDVLFANAGVGELAPLGSISEEHFDKAFGINVKGLLFRRPSHSYRLAVPCCAARGTLNPVNTTCRCSQVQRLDTHEGSLVQRWMGPPPPSLGPLTRRPSCPPSTPRPNPDSAAAWPCTPGRCPWSSSIATARSASAAPCPPLPSPSCAPSSPFATVCSSPASASTPGTGWPTPAATTPSPLSSAMPGR